MQFKCFEETWELEKSWNVPPSISPLLTSTFTLKCSKDSSGKLNVAYGFLRNMQHLISEIFTELRFKVDVLVSNTEAQWCEIDSMFAFQIISYQLKYCSDAWSDAIIFYPIFTGTDF